MSRIQQAFERRRGEGTLIPFLTAGDPDYETSLKLFRTVLAAGADIVEIGIPYSDPLADGPVIQAASLRSLGAGFLLPRAFELAAALREEAKDKAIILFTYVNPVLQYGPERFFEAAASAQTDGVIIPDLPYEESHAIRALADRFGIDLIQLVTPASPPERIAAICSAARGFVYLVSTLGVTGERTTLSDRVGALAEEVRRHTDLPIAVGFGVSRPEHAEQILQFADGVIIGSAFVRQIEATVAECATNAIGADTASLLQTRLAEFTSSFRQVMQSGVNS